MTKTLLFFATILGLWAEGALACQARILPLELLFAPFMKGPSFIRTNSHGSQFAGRTTLNSGSATVVVSTNNVTSDSLIFFSMEGNANLSSGTAIRPTEVKTISDGNYFTIGTQDGIGIARDTVLMWEIKKPGSGV